MLPPNVRLVFARFCSFFLPCILYHLPQEEKIFFKIPRIFLKNFLIIPNGASKNFNIIPIPPVTSIQKANIILLAVRKYSTAPKNASTVINILCLPCPTPNPKRKSPMAQIIQNSPSAITVTALPESLLLIARKRS